MDLVFIFLIGLTVIVQAIPRDDKNCAKQCGGVNNELKAFKEGKSFCLRHDDESGEGVNAEAGSECLIKCKNQDGMKFDAESQQKCFCDLCKSNEFTPWDGREREDKGDFKFFCTKPGSGRLKSAEDCQNTICAGKGNVKFYGPWCSPKFKP